MSVRDELAEVIWRGRFYSDTGDRCAADILAKWALISRDGERFDAAVERDELARVIAPEIASVCSDGNSNERAVARDVADVILAAFNVTPKESSNDPG